MKEAEILRYIRQYLNMKQSQGILMYVRYHVMPVLRSNGFGKTYYSQNKDMAGHPDLGGIINGIPWAIEVKSESGRITLSQQSWLERFDSHGGQSCIARSLQDAIKFIEGLNGRTIQRSTTTPRRDLNCS